ncbi:MAG: metal-dependent transcriptional regulator [Clostridia bacterium]|nr:metal-dependent transcriptional regulator [Clostridia bacterium]
MDLSGAKIRYLLVIYQLSREKGAARSVDIAIKLGVARPSVHRMLSSLVKMGLIHMEPRGSASLTGDGLKEALEYERQYEILYPFFSDYVGLSDYDSELSTIAALSSLPSVCIEALCKKVTAN